MTLLHSGIGKSALLDNYGEAEGTAPLLVTANATLAAQCGVGAGADLLIRVLNAAIRARGPWIPPQGNASRGPCWAAASPA